jgi:deaminated glutathione amidase
MKSLRVATCQFPVEATVSSNLRWILRQLRTAAKHEADLVHFSECALSGYAGVDVPDSNDYDWDELHAATERIMEEAARLRLWVVLGSSHRLTGSNKPHNSLYLIDSKGTLVDRYDKRFCTGELSPQPSLDLSQYTPGARPVTFRLKGITCGLAICYEYRFPELYRDYSQRGVRIIFQSFHNARSMVVEDESYNIWKTIVPSTMTCRAAENHFWISANNSTAKVSRWPSFAVRPDGQITGKLKLHRPGVLITDMVLDPHYFDAPAPWRKTAIAGRLHSGRLTKDPRSQETRSL